MYTSNHKSYTSSTFPSTSILYMVLISTDDITWIIIITWYVIQIRILLCTCVMFWIQQMHWPPPEATQSPVWVTGTWRCEECALSSSAAPWCPRPRGDAPAGWRGRWVSLVAPPCPLQSLSPESNAPEIWNIKHEIRSGMITVWSSHCSMNK